MGSIPVIFFDVEIIYIIICMDILGMKIQKY